MTNQITKTIAKTIKDAGVDPDAFLGWVANDWNESCLQGLLTADDHEGAHYEHAADHINSGFELDELIQQYRAANPTSEQRALDALEDAIGDEVLREMAIREQPDQPLCKGCEWPVDDAEFDYCDECLGITAPERVTGGAA
jgi:hypothetical protein